MLFYQSENAMLPLRRRIYKKFHHVIARYLRFLSVPLGSAETIAPRLKFQCNVIIDLQRDILILYLGHTS